jgi:hypothetical protein
MEVMMKLTVNVPDMLSLGRNGAIGQLPVDWQRVPQNVLDHIASVYFTQYITDAANAGGKDSEQADRLARATKRLEQMYTGEIRARGTGDGAEPVDPVEAEIHRSVVSILRNAYSNEKAPKEHKGHKRLLWIANERRKARGQEPVDSLQEVIDHYMGGAPNAAQIRREAERTVKARQVEGAGDFM